MIILAGCALICAAIGPRALKILWMFLFFNFFSFHLCLNLTQVMHYIIRVTWLGRQGLGFKALSCVPAIGTTTASTFVLPAKGIGI